MTTPTPQKETIRRKISRLCGSVGTQLLWLVPLWCVGWYVLVHLEMWLDNYFGVSVAQKAAAALSARAQLLQETMSVSTPKSMFTYVGALMSSMTAVTKAYSLASLAGFCSGIAALFIKISAVISVIYAVLGVRRNYRERKQIDIVTRQVVATLMPILTDIQTKLDRLTQQ